MYIYSLQIKWGFKKTFTGNGAPLGTTVLYPRNSININIPTTSPLVRAKQFSDKTKGKSKIWSWAPKGCPTPRHTD
jgi:hypothetical protein